MKAPPCNVQGKQNNILDFIFPIVAFKINSTEKTVSVEQFLGTGFLIGKNGFALTCTHVLHNFKNVLGAIFLNYDTNQWQPLLIDSIENHPKEDISIIHIANGIYDWKSLFVVNPEKQFGWIDYFLGGYPSEAFWERKIISEVGAKIVPYPELVSIKGHVRRRYNLELGINGIKGNSFYELSTLAGKGCSGSPVFTLKPYSNWEVIGVYSAEKRIFTEDNLGSYVSLSVSYAVRSDSFCDWRPDCLSGNSIQEETKILDL